MEAGNAVARTQMLFSPQGKKGTRAGGDELQAHWPRCLGDKKCAEIPPQITVLFLGLWRKKGVVKRKELLQKERGHQQCGNVPFLPATSPKLAQLLPSLQLMQPWL